MKKVSVIVPIYMTAFYLRECIGSLYTQTYKEITVYLINDGSKDECQDIIDEYVASDPERFICIRKENGGLSSARNAAIPLVKTEYVMFVDSDDFVTDNFVEMMLETAEKQQADIVECGFYKYFKNKEKIWIRPKLSGYAVVRENPDVLCDFTVPAWNKIYKTELFQKYGILYPDGRLYEDTATTPRLLARSGRVYSLPYPLVYYRQRSNSIMHTEDKRVFELYQIADLLKEDEYYKVYPVQYDCCRIDRIQMMISKLLRQSHTPSDITAAFKYLDRQIPGWQRNSSRLRRITCSKSVAERIYNFIFNRKSYLGLQYYFLVRKLKSYVSKQSY